MALVAGLTITIALVLPLTRGSDHPLRLAVLPIAPAVVDPELATAGAVLQERILLQALSTAPRGTIVLGKPVVAHLVGAERSVQALEQVAADYWLDISVNRLEGRRVRLHAKVARRRDFALLWGSDYEHDVGVIVAESQRYAAELSQRLIEFATTPSAADDVREHGGMAAMRAQRIAQDGRLLEAIAGFEQLAAAEPQNAIARGQLALTLVRAVLAQQLPADTGLSRAAHEAARVLHLDPHNRDALAALGGAQFHSGRDVWAAGASLRHAASVPHPVFEAHVWYSAWLLAHGRHHEGIRQAILAEATRPIGSGASPLARAFLAKGDYENAFRSALRTHVLHPASSAPVFWLWLTSVLAGRVEEEEHWLRGLVPTAQGAAADMPATACCNDLRRAYLTMLENSATTGNAGAAGLGAVVAAQLGDRDRTLKWLRVSLHSANQLAPVLLGTPVFDLLAGNREFEEMRARYRPVESEHLVLHLSPFRRLTNTSSF
jgi:hypothetical protein